MARIGIERMLRRFAAEESGATAIEYCLIASGVSIVIVAAATAIGASLNGKFDILATALR